MARWSTDSAQRMTVAVTTAPSATTGCCAVEMTEAFASAVAVTISPRIIGIQKGRQQP
jgi:hypothetical protein